MNQDRTDRHVVQLAGVSKMFKADGQSTSAVHNVTLEVHPGELVVFLGPSGSGKTTLLTLIAGFLKPTEGRIVLFGKRIEDYSPEELQCLRAQRIGFVFQTFHLIDALTVLENVMLVLRFTGWSKADARRHAEELLSRFSISELCAKYPTQLSQGQKQRVAVARAIANDAELILADEPTASLESKQGLEVVTLLHTLAQEQQRCVIVATHDVRVVEFADRVIRLEDGRIVEQTQTNGR